MSLKHDDTSIPALEGLLLHLDDLGAVFGPGSRHVIDALRQAVVEAVAARDRGDSPAAVKIIGAAMDRVAQLADEMVDPSEAALMRAVAQSFRSALLRGDQAEAAQAAAVMMRRSGAVEREKD